MKRMTGFVCPMHPEVKRIGREHVRNAAWRWSAIPLSGPPRKPSTPARCTRRSSRIIRAIARFAAWRWSRRTSSPASEEENAELRDMTRRFWIGGGADACRCSSSRWRICFPARREWVAGRSRRAGCNSSSARRWCCGAAGRFSSAAGNRSLTARLNMFTLIAMGVGVAYLYSAVVMLLPRDFPAVVSGSTARSAFISKRRRSSPSWSCSARCSNCAPAAAPAARFARCSISRRTPRASFATAKNATCRSMKCRRGDQLRVRPGEKVPVDGRVIEGTHEHRRIDDHRRADAGGERRPATKSPAAPLISTGSFIMEAERVGSETVLSQIVEMVAQAQRSRAPIQGLADKVAGWFVPAVIVIAVITFVVWAFVRTGAAPGLRDRECGRGV